MKGTIMRYFSRLKIHEVLIYSALWLIVILAPLLDYYTKLSSGQFTEWQWSGIFKVWIGILPFFILFLVHELLLIPQFLVKKRYIIYILLTILCLGFFSVANQLIRTSYLKEFPQIDKIDEMMPAPNPRNDIFDDRIPTEDEMFGPYNDGEYTDVKDMNSEKVHKPYNKRPKFGDKQHEFKDRPFPFPPYLLSMILAILMLGLNLGIKFLFKSMRDEEKMKDLERQNLVQELEYLKYQINPHFFMNTLNNIHALIDIDGEKAKSTVIELSKLMRYVLYESSHGNILLEKEIDFFRHYIALMRLRYNEKVKIEVDFPENVGEISVPPLLMVSFIENAFKHGISYQHDSFIKVSIKLDGNEMFFSCVNSKHATNTDSTSGIGLENVKKRLHLLFGSNYLLNIEDKDDVFKVLLVIPITI